MILSGSRDGDSFTLTLDDGGAGCGYGTVVEAVRDGSTATGTGWSLTCSGQKHLWSSPVVMAKQ